jgi:di/tripeptidase
MPAPIDEVTRKAIQRDYVEESLTYPQLAAKYGISEMSCHRICKGLTRQRQAVKTIVERTVAIARELNPDEILKAMISDLSAESANVAGKSKEGLANATLKAMELYRKWHPQTTSELVDLAIAIPDFDPIQFAQELRARLDKAA